MRKSSKAVSLLLSGLMATSCFSMAAATVTAAEIGSEETCADKTAQDLIDEGHQLVFFQFPESLWGPNSNVKYNAKKKTCNVFCNLYAIYGNKTEIKTKSWEAPSTSMKKDSKASDIYYFDITESGQGVIEEGADYGILFSTKANAGNPDLTQPNTDGFQTSDLYFNYQCIGDTYSVTTPKATRENTANSQKITFKAESSNGIGKEIRKVTSLCAYLDGAKEGNAPDSLEMANQLKEYLPNSLNNSSFVWAKIEPILAQYGTTAQAVYDTYVEKFKDLHDAATPYVHEEGVDDLKDDGTLKDIYRYSYTITEEKDEATGVVTEKKIKYPDLDLVRERLNLPNEPVVTNIDAVEATISGAVEAGSALPEITGGDDTYSVSASWAPEAETAAYSTTYTATVTFTAAENYAFTDATTATLKDGTFENVTLNEDGTLTATVSYTTEDEPTTEPETTTEPEPEDVLIVAGSEAEIFGTGWDGTNEANKMAKADDGTYTKDYTVSKAYSAVQLKSVKNGADWIGDKSGANVTFDLTGAGTFTVVYDPVENYTYVTGDIVKEITEFKYDTVFAVGNGEGFWLNGASWDSAYAANEMNKVADDLWEIEFTDVPDGFERQIKFAIDGAWTHNFGGVFEESGVVSAAAYNGDNITFDTDDTCTVKAQLDLREFDFTTKEGAKFTLTIEYSPEPESTTEEPQPESTTEEPQPESTTEEPQPESTTEEPQPESTTEEPQPESTTEEPQPETTTEPESEDVLIVAGSEAEIFGTGWDGTNEANKMAKADDGTYTKDYTVSKAYSAVQLKSVKNGADWIGDKSGANVTFDLTGAGTFTVVYDPVENYTYVTGDIVEEITEFKYDTVYAVGNGEGFWLNGASWDPAYAANEMTKVADDLWEIEFTDVPDGFERQIKFAIDGAWTHNFGGVFEDSGVVSAAAYNGDNITFDTDDTCTVKAQLDLREFDFTTKEGAKFTVTIEYAEVEEIGIIGDVNGDGRVTVEDATLIQRRGIELEKFDETQEKLGDVNRDGRISILDVTCVQKYLAEMTDGKGEAGNKLMADGTIVPANLPE